LGVIAIDTSGQIKVDHDVWIVAIRNDRYTYTGVYINNDYQERFNKADNWVEKLYAVLFYKTSNSLMKSADIIIIDKDFQGLRANHIKQNIQSLFAHFNRYIPEINFISERRSKEVREAHFITQKARHKEIFVKKNPPIETEFEFL
jgi:hypothetical protein